MQVKNKSTALYHNTRVKLRHNSLELNYAIAVAKTVKIVYELWHNYTVVMGITLSIIGQLGLSYIPTYLLIKCYSYIHIAIAIYIAIS